MKRKGRQAAAFLLTLLLVWQQGAFSCHGFSAAQKTRHSGRETSNAASETWIYGNELLPGDHILLGAEHSLEGGNAADQQAFSGYDFTLLNNAADGEEGRGLFFYSDPLGLSKTPQQFDKDHAENPDEDSKADGCSLWPESDLYIALNGASRSGSTDTHDAQVAEARLFYERLRANEDEWDGLAACTTGESSGEKVSLLSEPEFEALRTRMTPAFWYTGDQTSGFWLKTARADYTHQVRFVYSGDILPSLSTEYYYAYARGTRSVRPALRLNLDEIKFGAGSGTEEDPYRELALRPCISSLEAEGRAEVGGELRLTVSPAAAQCTYQWYRKEEGASTFETIEGAVENVLLLGPEDTGCIIRGEAVGIGDYIGKAQTTAGPVEKGQQKAPEGDELPGAETVRVTDRKIQIMSTAAGLEYALGTGAGIRIAGGTEDGIQPAGGAGNAKECSGIASDASGEASNGRAADSISPETLRWTSSGIFTELNASTEYGIYVRKAELPAYYASPAAGPICFTTKEAGAEMTLTLIVNSFNPRNPVEVLLTTEADSPGAPVVTRAAISASEPGIGAAQQRIVIEGIAMEVPFSLEIRKPGHLLYIEKGLSMTEDSELGIDLPCGDLNKDGSIDQIDRQLLLSSGYYGGAFGNASDAELLDLDGDGRIGWTDLYILMLKDNYGKRVRVQ